MCEFVYKNGRKCKNKKLNNSNYCHILGHNPSEEYYENIRTKIITEFKLDKIPLKNFTIHYVLKDGACLYRSIVNGLFHFNKRSTESLKEQFESNICFDKIDSIFFKNINFNEKHNILPDNIETIFSILLQKLCIIFVKNNRGLNIISKLPILSEINPNMMIEDIIRDIHNLSIDNYLELYEVFSGDDNNSDIDIWGGLPEILIVSFLFNININVYTPFRFDERTLKTTCPKSWKNDNNIFLKNINSVGDNKDFKINLIFTESRDGPHYDFLELI